MRIKIICLGKIKADYLRSGIADYLKLISPFARVEIVEIPEEKIGKSLTAEQIKKREGAEILRRIKEQDCCFFLDEKGEQLSSLELAALLAQRKSTGDEAVFIIGGPLGLDASLVKNRAQRVISFSRLTFTHQMVRLFLLEQIYRSLTIMTEKKYHY